jgi:hypothetical protein
MTLRMLLVALLGTLTGAARLGAAAPVPAGKTADGPPVVVQLAPLGQLIDDAKAIAKAVAGDQAADQITQAITGKLGEKGFAGIDTKKPMAAYVNLPERLGIAGKQPNEINPKEMLKGYKGVLVIPATTPDEFKEFFARAFPNDPAKFIPVPGKDGLYAVESKDGAAEIPVRLRFHAGHAYFGFNLTDDEMDAKALVDPAALIDPKEKAQVALRAYPDRYPPGLMKEAMDAVDGMLAQMKGQLGGQEQMTWAGTALTAYMKMVKRYADQLMKESTEVGYKLMYDRATTEAAWEFVVVPKKGTSLAADIAARKPSTNKFAGLLTNETAAGVTLELPLFAGEIKEIITGLIEEGRKQKDKAPPPAQPVLDELLQGLARTVKTGEFDIAAAVNGPDKDGHFTAVAAVAFEDAGKLEKALKAAEKDFPKEMKDAIQFDAEKAGGVNIHKITPPEPPQGPPAEFGKVFGATAVYVAFGEHGIYAAVGTNALDAIKKALAAKPAAAKPLDVVVNPKRLQQLVAVVNEQAGQSVGQVLGADDKRQSAVSVSVEGTDALRVRLAVNLKLTLRAVVGARTGPGGPPAAVPVID